MKIAILRGGSSRRRRRSLPGQAGSTRERGVMALDNGSGRWVLVNMSPGVTHQLDSGLLSLRDGAPIDLYATPAVFEQLTTALQVLPVLQHCCGVHWRVVPVAGDRRVASFRVEGMPSLECTAVATQCPLPPHLAHLAHGERPQVGDSIALAVQDLATGQRVFCAPGLSQIGSTEFEWMREADCLLLDNLLPGAGAPVGVQPWLALLRGMPARHKVLFDDGPTLRTRVGWAREGITLAYDGMEIAL